MHVEPRPQKFRKVSVVVLDVDQDNIKQICQNIIQCESHVSKLLTLDISWASVLETPFI